MQIEMNDKRFKRFTKDFRRWINGKYKNSVNKGVKAVTHDYKKLLKAGLNADGSPMNPVNEVTMNNPIRRGGPDKRIRRDVNPDRTKPIQATGATIKSLHSKRSSDEWVIQPSTAKADMILSKNKSSYGRDPLFISEKQVKILEDAILDDFEKIFL